jgi:AraC-like DNA-binding protein
MLLDYVIKNKPYLNSELNLRQLAEETGIPSHQLSMLLSIYLNQNFYSFINGFRIEEAKRLLAEEDGTRFNIIEVAYEAGFNSKTTFNTAFKKSEGLTPSEYRLKNQRKE